MTVPSPSVGDDGRGQRLTKPERREQLLDAAEEIVVSAGVASVTMEGVAAQAGVSKALPYAHFANSDALLTSLYVREMTQLTARMEAALADPSVPGPEQLRLAFASLFDVLSERGPVLAAFVRSPIAERVGGGQRQGQRYVARLLRRTLGLEVDHSIVLGMIVFGALAGAVESFARRDAPRAVIEERVLRFVVGGAQGLSE